LQELGFGLLVLGYRLDGQSCGFGERFESGDATDFAENARRSGQPPDERRPDFTELCLSPLPLCVAPVAIALQVVQFFFELLYPRAAALSRVDLVRGSPIHIDLGSLPLCLDPRKLAQAVSIRIRF
jgi:hypothetical protein